MANGPKKLSPEEQLSNLYDGLAEDVLEGHIPVSEDDMERASKVFDNVAKIHNLGESPTPDRSSGKWAERTGKDEPSATSQRK